MGLCNDTPQSGSTRYRRKNPNGPNSLDRRSLNLNDISVMSAEELKEKARKLIDANQVKRFRHIGSSYKFEEEYELNDEIGSGAYGKVHIAVHKQTRIECAVKVMEK